MVEVLRARETHQARGRLATPAARANPG
jgi:hypothetical protein